VLVKGLSVLLWCIAGLWGVLTLRQWLWTMNRLSDRSRETYAGIVEGCWPKLSVIVLAHNSQALAGEALQALCAADYPEAQIQIVAVNDRSTDRTRQIIDEQAALHPGRIVPVHRNDGRMGRAACLLSAMPHVDGDFLLVLDAQHCVAPGLIKQLMAPFFDPEVGSVAGRVMPLNVQANLLTRLTDLGMSALQEVEQQARMNLGFMPQPGSGVVAWRRSALVSACAASSDAMADEVDVAHRLRLRGWQQVHQGWLAGHAVLPQTWEGQGAQLAQHALMHQGAAARHMLSSLMARHGTWAQKIDAFLSHVAVWMPALLWLAAVSVFGLYLAGVSGVVQLGLAVLTLAACASVQGSAPFFQVALGARLDGRHRALRLMPLQWILGVPGIQAQASLTWQRIQVGLRGAYRWHRGALRARPAVVASLPQAESWIQRQEAA
jgi:cellulose synthase/poly-beta-1,6-N-acetylglucosamine synthase-like glycosyltransferase